YGCEHSKERARTDMGARTDVRGSRLRWSPVEDHPAPFAEEPTTGDQLPGRPLREVCMKLGGCQMTSASTLPAATPSRAADHAGAARRGHRVFLSRRAVSRLMP